MSKPLSAQTWAMPLPIWPAPMTPMRLIMTGYSSVYFFSTAAVSSGTIWNRSPTMP